MQFRTAAVDFLLCLLNRLPHLLKGVADVCVSGGHLLAGRRLGTVIEAQRQPLTGAYAGAAEVGWAVVFGPHPQFENAHLRPAGHQCADGLADPASPDGRFGCADARWCLERQAGGIALFGLDFQLDGAEADVVANRIARLQQIVRAQVSFLVDGAKPFHVGRRIGAGFDVKAGGLELAAEPVFEHDAGVCVSGFFKRPVSCQCASIGGVLQSGGGDRMIIHLQTRLLHRRIELGPQLNFGSSDGNETVAQCLLACRPAGVRRKLKPHPSIRQLRVRPHRYLVAIARLAAGTHLIFETLPGLAHLIDPSGLARFHRQHRGGAVGQM